MPDNGKALDVFNDVIEFICSIDCTGFCDGTGWKPIEELDLEFENLGLSGDRCLGWGLRAVGLASKWFSLLALKPLC